MRKKLSMQELRPIMQAEFDKGKSFRMITHGTSMKPLIGDGCDTVILDAVRSRPKRFDVALYIRDDGSFVLHRIVGQDSRGYIMCGDNQTVREYGIRDTQIIALASGVIKDGRTYPFSGIRYTLYTRMVCALRPIRYVYSRRPWRQKF